MLARFLSVLMLAFVSISTSGNAFAIDVAFAHKFLTGSGQIVRFPAGDPASPTVVGPQNGSFIGIDFDPGARLLWAINLTTLTVGTVDQTTGAYTSTAGLQGNCCISALTIDPVGGTFYVAKGDEFIYSLDPATGVTVTQGMGAPSGTAITALAIDCSGRMFASAGDGNTENLYQVHLGAGPTLIGSPGFSGATSLEFDNLNGILYGWFHDAGTSTHAVVDVATAQLSQSSQLPGRYRMAIRNVCSRIFADSFDE